MLGFADLLHSNCSEQNIKYFRCYWLGFTEQRNTLKFCNVEFNIYIYVFKRRENYSLREPAKLNSKMEII